MHAAGGKVGPGHEVDQLVGGGVGEFDQMQRRVAELAGIVRRDVGGHADGDAGGAVGEQVGEIGGEDRRLLLARRRNWARKSTVSSSMPSRSCARDLGQPRLGVAVGGGVIAVDIAEIALAVDQRIADGEVLREARQRVVDGLIAVGMEVAHGVADDLGAFANSPCGSSRSWRMA